MLIWSTDANVRDRKKRFQDLDPNPTATQNWSSDPFNPLNPFKTLRP